MSFHLQSECDYDEWMFENYPGYSILDAFQALKPYYLNTPFENAVSSLNLSCGLHRAQRIFQYESDVEYSSDGSSPRMESDLSNCSFLPLDPDEGRVRSRPSITPSWTAGWKLPLRTSLRRAAFPSASGTMSPVEDLSDSDSSDDSDLATSRERRSRRSSRASMCSVQSFRG